MPLKLRDIFNDDLDNVFSYRTQRYVVIRDMWLGCTNRCLELAIILYVAIFAIWLNEGYLNVEYTNGQNILVKSGSELITGTSDTEMFFEYPTVLSPILDQEGFFFATKIVMTSDQTQDTCVNKKKSCTSDSDCDLSLGGYCSDSYCYEQGWCPQEDTSDSTTSEVFYTNPNIFKVWFKSTVTFPDLATTIYSNIDSSEPVDYPKDKATQYSVQNLLSSLSENQQVNYTNISDTGAQIHLMFTWECLVGHSCSPELEAKRVDISSTADNNTSDYIIGLGYDTYQYHYYKDSTHTVLYRIQMHMTGIKFFVDTKGIGKKISITAFVLQLSLGVALLKISTLVVDFLMLYIFPKRAIYEREKFTKTEDFSDIDQRKKEEEEQKERDRVRKLRKEMKKKDDDDMEDDY